MEQPLVEVVGVAVVAEVQPHHGEAGRQQLRGGHAHVAGFGAALPAMQQQGQRARRGGRQLAVPGLQDTTIAAVEQQFLVPRPEPVQQRLATTLAQPA